MEHVATEPSPTTPLFSAGLEARTHGAEVVLDGTRVAYWSYEPVQVTPETRTILRVTLEDAVEASKLFDELMGDEVEPRRQFIERNAKYVSNLDV